MGVCRHRPSALLPRRRHTALRRAAALDFHRDMRLGFRRHLRGALHGPDPPTENPLWVHPGESQGRLEGTAAHGARHGESRQPGTGNRTLAASPQQADGKRSGAAEILRTAARPRGHGSGVVRGRRHHTLDEPCRGAPHRHAAASAGTMERHGVGGGGRRSLRAPRSHERLPAFRHMVLTERAAATAVHPARHPPRAGAAGNRVVEDTDAGAHPRNHEFHQSHPLADRDAHHGRL